MPRKPHMLYGGLDRDTFYASGNMKFSRRGPREIREAFRDYVDMLTDNGIAVEHEELTIFTREPPYVCATISVRGLIKPESRPDVQSKREKLLRFPPRYAGKGRQ